MTVKPPTIGVLRAADVLEKCTRHYLTANSSVFTTLGRYEAPVESANLIAMAIRHIEGIVLLARDDLVTLPSAAVLARSVLEAGGRAMWLIAPNDIFECEARWLAHVRAENQSTTRLAREVAKAGGRASWLRDHAEALRQFADEVQSALPNGIVAPPIPNFRQTLESLGRTRAYVEYVQLSQYTHATHAATSIYRKHLGHLKELGEFVTPAHWQFVFNVAWRAFEAAGRAFFEKVSPTTRPFGVNLPDEMKASIVMIDVDQ